MLWGRKRTVQPAGKSTQKMIQQAVGSKQDQESYKQTNLYGNSKLLKGKILIPALEPPSTIQQVKPISYEHPKGYVINQVKGMNTIPFLFSVMTKGNAVDGNLFTVDTGSLLEGHNGILAITAFKLILFNVPQKDVDTIPEIFHLTCNQLSGMYDQTGNPSNIVATSTPSAISSSLDEYNLQTASIIYSMARDSINWDLASIPGLTFDLKVGMNKQQAVYPLQTEILVQFSVVKIMI